jgi:23S rRNA (adenine2503-C2)-methyltransferase
VTGLNVFGLTCKELADEMSRRYGKGIYHAAALYREVFKKGNTSFSEAPEFSRSISFTRQLNEEVRLPSCRITEKLEDGVTKFASLLGDGHSIESVIIPAQGRTTLCVSSQVGCRMGCRFCVTGGMGFLRSLTAEEIVWQVYAARFVLNCRIDNIVFMGMGEPLDNFENVMQAVLVMNDQRGLDIAFSHITISTSGHVDGIRRLAGFHLPRLRLAVSLNAAEDGLRSHLMPINRRFPLACLKKELQAFPLGRGGVIFVEYVLLKAINDSRDDAKRLAQYLEGLPVRVNVIAYNAGGSTKYAPPSPEEVLRFCGWLAEEKLFVCLRQPRGQSIMAACGQLGALLAEGIHGKV